MFIRVRAVVKKVPSGSLPFACYELLVTLVVDQEPFAFIPVILSLYSGAPSLPYHIFVQDNTLSIIEFTSSSSFDSESNNLGFSLIVAVRWHDFVDSPYSGQEYIDKCSHSFTRTF